MSSVIKTMLENKAYFSICSIGLGSANVLTYD